MGQMQVTWQLKEGKHTAQKQKEQINWWNTGDTQNRQRRRQRQEVKQNITNEKSELP